MHVAAYRGYLEVGKLLWGAGAKDLPNARHKRPSDLAAHVIAQLSRIGFLLIPLPMPFQPMNSKVLSGYLRLGVVVSLLLASSHARAEQRTCLRIDLNRAQQTSTDLVQSAIARDQLVELLAPAHRCPQGATANVTLQKLIPSGNPQGSDSSEGEDKKDANQTYSKRTAKKPLRKQMNLSRHSRRQGPKNYDVSNHYVQEGQAFPTPLSLANDAKQIHEAVHSSQSRGGTTILCVALVDANGHVRKFAFCNHQGSMPLGCFHKAKELGYDEGSMDKEQAQRHIHAEVQFTDPFSVRDQRLCCPLPQKSFCPP